MTKLQASPNNYSSLSDFKTKRPKGFGMTVRWSEGNYIQSYVVDMHPPKRQRMIQGSYYYYAFVSYKHK